MFINHQILIQLLLCARSWGFLEPASGQIRDVPLASGTYILVEGHRVEGRIMTLLACDLYWQKMWPGRGLGVFSCMRAKSLQLCPTLCDPMDCSPPRLLCPWDSPGKNTRVSCHALLQGIFLIQGLNLDLLSFLHMYVGSLPLTAPEKPLSSHTESKSIDLTPTLLSRAGWTPELPAWTIGTGDWSQCLERPDGWWRVWICSDVDLESFASSGCLWPLTSCRLLLAGACSPSALDTACARQTHVKFKKRWGTSLLKITSRLHYHINSPCSPNPTLVWRTPRPAPGDQSWLVHYSWQSCSPFLMIRQRWACDPILVNEIEREVCWELLERVSPSTSQV